LATFAASTLVVEIDFTAEQVGVSGYGLEPAEYSSELLVRINLAAKAPIARVGKHGASVGIALDAIAEQLDSDVEHWQENFTVPLVSGLRDLNG
jgi:hypothetical protein